jgi:hypothetical protein
VIGTTLNGRFILERELGRGGMGAVYRATDQVLQRTVAIKTLRDPGGEEVGRKIRLEAQILARLLHENIVRLYDFNADDQTYYFIMEEVDGTSFFRRWKKIDLPERLRILAQVAEALDYAHRQGVIHRDIKPGNILLTASDQAKLSDFGLSLLTDVAQESGIVKGTPHYMSPEQAKGKRLDHRSDLYGLGVVLYECATGALPFSGSTMAIMAQHANAAPEPPRARNPEVGHELDALIRELLAKAPDARPSAGREVADRLRALIRSPSARLASPSVAAELPTTPTLKPRRSLVGTLVDAVTADPLPLAPEERYLCGHYLAYLLGGSRRRGFLLRRPLDPLNADRARLLLAMTALSLPDGSDVTMGQAAALLDQRLDCRPALSPMVVMKYLAARATPARRKKFRQVREQLRQASDYAAAHLTDPQGVLNPGLMPQVLDDLRRLAPARTEVDGLLVQRWNQVTEVWRGIPEFRESVLRYATKSAWRDPSSIALWPEVVYPLIERARRQRQLRSGTEVFWDAICATLLHVPDAGVRMDRAIARSVPEPIVEELDVAAHSFEDDIQLDLDAGPAPDVEEARPSIRFQINPASFHDLEAEPPTRDLIRLVAPDPQRLTMADLRALWQEAIIALRSPGTNPAARTIPIGPYRVSVVASIRSRSAGQVAIQGMKNKQIELHVPPFAGSAPNSKTVLAVWLYQDQSLAIAHADHLGTPHYVLWDAPNAQQTNFDEPAELNHILFTLGLEAPDQLDRVLSKGFRPTNPV